LIFQPKKIFVFSRDGGEDYDDWDIYMLDQNVGNAKIININSKDFASIIFDHFIFMNMDFFIVPNIDDGIATWKLVVRYENNDELASYYISHYVTIEE